VDFLYKIEVQVQKAVTAAFYKRVLGEIYEPCIFFVLGNRTEFISPQFDFALFGDSLNSFESPDIKGGIIRLRNRLESAQRIAIKYRREIVGIAAVWDCLIVQQRHESFGAVADFAKHVSIPFIIEAPVTAGETIWRLSIYFTGRFPHEALSYKMIYQRAKTPDDNPRRIKSEWNKILGEC
jgi:hypothetical protein